MCVSKSRCHIWHFLVRLGTGEFFLPRTKGLKRFHNSAFSFVAQSSLKLLTTRIFVKSFLTYAKVVLNTTNASWNDFVMKSLKISIALASTQLRHIFAS
ncbi:hypothetical protein HMPREF2604_08270 [Corynebacterium sp. HMSC055A01]|nr:hypothetical protein HMPREF2604_08270 [Corynebacterium sp. HMSC055A01]